VLTLATIESILRLVPHRSIGLIGDLFLDRYFDIESQFDELSVETGLTAYQVTAIRSYPGALGTVLNNLTALGVGRIVPVSMIGDDGEGYELRQALSKMPGVDTQHLVVDSRIRTPTYAKPMRDGVELNRLDTKNRTETPADVIQSMIRRAQDVDSQVDAWLVLDQVRERNSGVVTQAVRDWCAETGRQKFILADSRERIREFSNVCIKPNERESVGMTFDHVPAAFVTLGDRGIQLFDNHQSKLIPAYPVSGPIDPCGAGDSCSAGILSAMVSRCSKTEAAAFGNLVANITIQQIGVTGTATPSQIRKRAAELNLASS
jgi:bifunctional ADP-heptose synthase (sugar kinase/adenylyltransferase)